MAIERRICKVVSTLRSSFDAGTEKKCIGGIVTEKKVELVPKIENATINVEDDRQSPQISIKATHSNRSLSAAYLKSKQSHSCSPSRQIYTFT
jgi:hypothetical protein